MERGIMLKTGIKEQLDFLIKLQELDNIIDKLNETKAAIPEKIRINRERITNQEQNITNFKSKYTDIQKSRRADELECETKNGEIKKLQAKLYEVKTNKEYTTMQHEIETIKEEKAKLEELIIQKMFEEDEAKKSISGAQETLKEIEKEVVKEEAVHNKELKDVEAQLEVQLQGRANMTNQIEAVVLKEYEKIRKSKGGVAIAKIINNTCGECYMTIRPQLIIEVNKHEQLILCDSCSRILYPTS